MENECRGFILHFFHLYGTNHDVLIVRHTFHHLHNIYRRVRRPRRTAFQRISPDYSPWHTLSLMYSVAVKFALRFTNGAPSRRTLRDSVSLYLSVSIFAGMYRIGKLLSTASYPLTNPDLAAIILKLIHKCREKEEYFSFARLERVRSVQAPRRGRRRSLWSRTAEFSLSCSV